MENMSRSILSIVSNSITFTEATRGILSLQTVTIGAMDVAYSLSVENDANDCGYWLIIMRNHDLW